MRDLEPLQQNQIETKIQTIDRLKTVFDQISEQDEESLNKILNLLLKDQVFQAAVNEKLASRGSQLVEFQKCKTIIDLKDPAYGITFDLLLDSMNSIKMKDDAPLAPLADLEAQLDYFQNKLITQNQGYVENQGINQIVHQDNHDYLKYLQTQQKKKTYPSMFMTSMAFQDLLFPASSHNREER